MVTSIITFISILGYIKVKTGCMYVVFNNLFYKTAKVVQIVLQKYHIQKYIKLISTNTLDFDNYGCKQA